MNKIFNQKTFHYLSLIMAFTYIILGMWVYKHKMISPTDQKLNILAGVLLVIYGGFRGYRAYMGIKTINTLNDQNNAS
ncbi:MAG: C4-dicarboxylate ABC transporter [Bacteroidia bacterium]|nr:C4-dicarboxylate ABC transporter [Bacteroidia bacterium]